MFRISAFLAATMLVCASAQAAPPATTTITVTNATGTLGISGATVTGPATFTNGIPSGTFSATATLSDISGSTVTVPFTIKALTDANNNVLSGSITLPASLLLGGGSGTGSATTSGGTGVYSGDTYSFPSLAGTGTLSGTTINLSFSGAGTLTTGGGGGGATAPAITAVQNNYSYILPGLPNYGIAPGTLFIVKGTNLNSQPLSALQSSASPGLPLTLNGTSVAVTVNGTTTHPGIYYTAPSQLGAVLPSSTPIGNGTLTVTNGTQTSPPAPIQVVQSALGLDSLYGNGVGSGVVTDGSGNILTASNSASPGQVVILWGSGVGADTSNDDLTYPMKQNDLTNIPLQVYIGGISASVLYRGRSQYPGVDQVNLTIPSNVPTGCSVSVMAVSGNVVSNSVTIPVASGGGACSDSNFGVSGGQTQTLSGKSSVSFGYLSLMQSTIAGSGSNTPTVTNVGGAVFESWQGLQFATNQSAGSASLGSCVVMAPVTSSSTTTGTYTGLDAGSVTVTGPTGTQTLQSVPTFAGFYGGTLPAGFIPSGGGSFTFKGTGGKDVGPFSATLNFPTPLVWTNMSAVTSITRSQGVPINWTGGAPGTYVSISGSSTATIATQSISVSFVCNAAVAAGQFTVPSAVLLALPVGSGSLSVENVSSPGTFSATGLDLAYTVAGVQFSISPSYQ